MADKWTDKIDPYLDGELAGREMKELDSHLRSCPGCAADVANRLQFKRAEQSAGTRYFPSPEFRQRVRRSIATAPRRSPIRAWLFAGTLAAVALVAIVVGVSFRQQQFARQHVISEIADLHVATLASANPVDVVSTDRHTVKPWFEGKIPFTFNLPELQNSEYVLVGGRVAYLRQAPGAELIFQVRKHHISAFIIQERSVAIGFGTDSGVQQQATFNLETWSGHGLRYFVIGDAGGDDIRKLAALLKKAAED